MIHKIIQKLNWYFRTLLTKLNIKRKYLIGNSYLKLDYNSRLPDFKSSFFDIANICEDKLPDCDLLMVRDCLFHLSYSDINKFLKNIANVNYKYLLTTTHMLDKKFVNKDIKSANFRLIDLFKEPFNFDSKKVINRVDDFPVEESDAREMILICKPDVPKFIKY